MKHIGENDDDYLGLTRAVSDCNKNQAIKIKNIASYCFVIHIAIETNCNDTTYAIMVFSNSNIFIPFSLNDHVRITCIHKFIEFDTKSSFGF